MIDNASNVNEKVLDSQSKKDDEFAQLKSSHEKDFTAKKGKEDLNCLQTRMIEAQTQAELKHKENEAYMANIVNSIKDDQLRERLASKLGIDTN